MYYTKKRTKAVPGADLPLPLLDLALELHDIRDTKTNLIAREDEVKEEMLKLLDAAGLIPAPDAERRTKGLGVFRVWRKRGREYLTKVSLAALRDRLGAEAEEYIDHYREAIVISHLDPVGIERAIEAKKSTENLERSL